jgi:DNA repair exonuclease SbcCD ATPase subunit
LKTVRKQLKENQEMTSITMNKQNFTNQQDDAKVRELQGRIMELQNQIHYQEQSYYERELELKQELNRVRDAKKRLEQEYAGANLKEIEQEAYMIQELENRLKSMEMKHQLQVQDLSSKLRWYMENQNMIDASDAELKNLRQTVKMLEQKLGEAGTSQNGQSITFYKRRVKELENQIAEMKRHEKDPNTITQLIRAVKSDPEFGEESSHVKMLERKVELLESELQETSDNAAKNLRILKQETDRLTLHYEKQIQDLQSELSKYNITFDGPSKKKSGPPLSKVKELQKQLDENRVFYRKKIADLETKLKENDMKSPREDDDKYKQKAKKLEAELEYRDERIKRLEQQLLEKPVVETKPAVGTESKREEDLRRDTEQLKRELDQYKREAEQYRTQYQVLLQRSQWTVERKDDTSNHEYQRLVRELEECKMKLEVVSMAKTTIMSHAEEMIRAAQVETQQMRSQYESENKQIRAQVESEKRDLVERQERELRWYKEQLEQYKQQLIEAQHVNRKQMYEEQTTPPKKRLLVDKDRVEFSAVTNDDRIRQLKFLESRLQDIESNHKLKEMEFNRILHETKHRADMEMSFAKQQFEVAIQEKNREVQKFKLQLQNIMTQLTILKQNRQQVVPVLRRATATTTTVPQVQTEPPTTPNENQNRIFEKRNQETSEKEVIPVASPPPKPRTQVVPQPYVK